jgi:hypothetical protein
MRLKQFADINLSLALDLAVIDGLIERIAMRNDEIDLLEKRGANPTEVAGLKKLLKGAEQVLAKLRKDLVLVYGKP